MHRTTDILPPRINIPHNPPMAIAMVRHHRYCAARCPPSQFLLGGAVTTLATLWRVHAAQAHPSLAAGERIAIHRAAISEALLRGRHGARRLPPLRI